MRRLVFSGLLIMVAQFINAQIHAITDTGDQVVLYQNKTWRYINDSINTESKISINEKEFSKDKKSSFLVKSKNLNIGIWIDPQTWSFSKEVSNNAAEF